MKKVRWILLLLLLSCLLTACSRQAPLLEIRMLNVGQGDAILLTTREGEHILIDAGPTSHRDLLCLRLEELGVRHIRLALFTHPDEDHIGGAAHVLEQFDVAEVWTGGQVSEEECYLSLIGVIEARQIPHRTVGAGDTLAVGDVRLFVLSPTDALSGDSNADSLVIRVSCREVSALFTGDGDEATEKMLLETYGREMLRADVLKVGHHGSATSTSAAFLEAVSPTYALLSAGRGNPHGHPHGAVLTRLEASGVTVMRTDLLGEICLQTDGYEVFPVKEST